MILNSTLKETIYSATIFDLKIPKNYIELKNLVNSNTYLEISDEIESQLEELIKLRTPSKKYNSNEFSIEIEKILNGTPIKEYGNWVHYPWINKLVHVLGEKEFIEVRTNRNKNKITQLEQDKLKTKKIGIIGLSVGKSIATAIAMERICGELVLADFDIIELSNLNRIQTGIHNFGVNKTTVVAREIAEIDPYLKVTCFNDGLTKDNANDFFTKNGKLDICVEVCDGLYTKIFSREKAKEFGIPVVMDTNDRGMIDVERFDLEPDKGLFHGFIDHLNLDDINEKSTPQEKVPFINSIIGKDTMSNKLKESMCEIGKSITSWPQLASSVILGGAVTCNVCRRILLNEFKNSGRYFVDINEIIKND